MTRSNSTPSFSLLLEKEARSRFEMMTGLLCRFRFLSAAALLVVRGEGASAYVRDDDELVVPLQILQRRRAVVERRPTRDRLTEVYNLVRGRSDAPPPSQSTVHFFGGLRIEH